MFTDITTDNCVMLLVFSFSLVIVYSILDYCYVIAIHFSLFNI